MGIYGVDVAATRADDLDKKMIAIVEQKVSPSVLDIGCGAGGQSLCLASCGASVLGVDIDDYRDTFQTLRKVNNFDDGSLEFVCGDIEQLESFLKGRIFDDCCFQRVIHYFPYVTAVEILKKLRTYVTDGLYISVTGLESAIGEDYKDSVKPVAQRFCTLDKEHAEIFGIHAPLCLYTQSEFEGLLQESGWSVVGCWVSAFGNIKAICHKK